MQTNDRQACVVRHVEHALLQPEYPFKPPAIMMLTPSGRFATGTRLCLSMSDFHPVGI